MSSSLSRLKTGPFTIARSVFFFPILLSLTGCSVEQIKSSWVPNSPTIDGNLEDWKGATVVVFGDVQVSIGVGNDSSCLYIAGRIANTDIQRAIGQSGIVLWLDPDGRKGKDLEIHFPASKAARTDLNRGGFWDGLSDEQKARAQEELKEMGKGVLVIDKRKVESHVYKEGNAEGFAGVIIESQGLVSFEARIPLRIERDFPEFVGMHPGSTLTIGIGSRATGFEGVPPRDEAGFSGSGGPRGNFLRGGPQSKEDKEIWLEVSLAGPR